MILRVTAGIYTLNIYASNFVVIFHGAGMLHLLGSTIWLLSRGSSSLPTLLATSPDFYQGLLLSNVTHGVMVFIPGRVYLCFTVLFYLFRQTFAFLFLHYAI